MPVKETPEVNDPKDTAGFRPDRIRAIVSSMNTPDAKAIHNVGQQGTEASHVPAPAPAQHGRTR